MRVEEGQTFLSFYNPPGSVEVATGIQATDETVFWNGDARQLGQVATPDAVAKLMARWVLSAGPRKVLDPAAGLGALLRACRLQAAGVELVGIESDEKTLMRAKEWAPKGASLMLADYLFTDLQERFGGIIANPPYVKAHRLGYSPGQWAEFDERFGVSLGRLTNLYALFLLKIWEDLAPGGRAAVIVPAEFLNANFGEAIKRRLLETGGVAGIAVFSPSERVFDDALTTSAIVCFRKEPAPASPGYLCLVHSVDDAAAFVENLLDPPGLCPPAPAVALSSLDPREKWLNAVINTDAVSPGDEAMFTRRIGDLFFCRRGIATGANDYFCLRPADLKRLGLGSALVEPCVTRATDAKGLVFSEHSMKALIAGEHRCFLLNPADDGPGLAEYLQEGRKLGIPERHLPRHRPVWYRQENRPPAAIWVAVFSRQRVKFILNRTRTKNLTCFHGLYPRPGFEAISSLMALFLNSSWGKQAFSRVNRFYGGGLNKLEPKDVEAMPCPDFPNLTATESARLIDRMETLGAEGNIPEEELDRLLHEYLDREA